MNDMERYQAWAVSHLKKKREPKTKKQAAKKVRRRLPDYGTVVEEKYLTLPNLFNEEVRS